MLEELEDVNIEDTDSFDESIGALLKEEVNWCEFICCTNPKPPCFGEYPNCILSYRGED